MYLNYTTLDHFWSNLPENSQISQKFVAPWIRAKENPPGRAFRVRPLQCKRTGRQKMFDNVKKAISSITEIGIALLALAIVAGLLVGSPMPFLGNVVGNITGLVTELGNAGLAGLISLGVVLWLIQNR